MSKIIGFFLVLISFNGWCQLDTEYLQMSYNFLDRLKTNQKTDAVVDFYKNIDLDSLAFYIDTEDEKKVFWINTYNAFVQQILTENSSLFEDRGAFFSAKQIDIAGVKMSFDDIEHGIIRSSRWKLSLGYIRNPFGPKFIKLLRTKKPDGRVHFALNCGAISCPPIATFHAKNIQDELDTISKQYLTATTIIDKKIITVTPLMSWFRGDFGGKKGIKRDFLIKYKIIESTSHIELNFGNYDWTLSLGNYTTL